MDRSRTHDVPRPATPTPPLHAYIAAHYRVDAPHGSFTIRIGGILDVDLARQSEGTPWAILTAWNPGSVPTDASTNARAAAELAALLDMPGAVCWPALNHDGHGRHAEPSQFVAGLAADDADRLAARFGQFALVAGVAGGPARLRVLAPRAPPSGVDTRFVDWVASGTPSTAAP